MDMYMDMSILVALFKAVLQSPNDKYAGDAKLTFDHLHSLCLSATYHLVSGRTEKTLPSIKYLYSRKRR